ncbi:unnamed protein product [Paramecium pentaurelia]|uniref:Protein kinase domain-containing protein n=1 Tax=Paramecium pentaurelia TaxID=43138 RepID=A0A8S1SIF6_9CILI|nr:unnamed protein product [Paramecium pentaurelia]
MNFQSPLARNLFSTPEKQQMEPELCKKVIIDEQIQQFNNSGKKQFKFQIIPIKTQTPIKQKHHHSHITPSTSENDCIGTTLVQRFQNQMTLDQIQQSPPSTPKNKGTKSHKELTAQKQGTATPKKKKSAIKSIQTSAWAMDIEDQSEEESPTFERSRYYNEYTQLAVIGNGNFGTVYKCRNNIDKQIYAIKCVKLQGCGKSYDAAESLNEAQALAYLTAKGRCKNIIRYYTAWNERCYYYLCMEYCDYNVTSLQELRKESNQKLEEFEVKKILKDILQGLKFLHEQSITHFDVKPDNILYSKTEGCYKLADLGLSRLTQLKKGEDINEGDSRYLAPEILSNLTTQSDLSKSDIFSLGASIYEIMIGETLPTCGERWLKLRQGLTVNDFGSDFYSIKLRRLICRMMNPNSIFRLSAKASLEDPYLYIPKENFIKWEKLRGFQLRQQLDVIKIMETKKRQMSV